MKKTFSKYYCEESFIYVVLLEDEIKMDKSKDWLIIGFPGVDGIEFRVKSDQSQDTVFAFYPFDNEHMKIADSAEHLVLKWKAGVIVL